MFIEVFSLSVLAVLAYAPSIDSRLLSSFCSHIKYTIDPFFLQVLARSGFQLAARSTWPQSVAIGDRTWHQPAQHLLTILQRHATHTSRAGGGNMSDKWRCRRAVSKERVMMRAMFTAVSFALPSPFSKSNSMAATNVFTKAVCNVITIAPLRLAGLWDSVRAALF
ncbi:hypothetical protein C8J57DRAFT_1509099 [Mycena rebaudengoi]|nr:hypothetical protein C8J57DRAFT_1509099 [Mycena rebaudengoi]